MKTSYIVIGISAFLLGILLPLFYLGAFKSVVVSELSDGPFTLVYEKNIGPYQETGKIQDKIYNSLLNNEKIETFKGFGLYYDNPAEVDKSKLRSISGCILEPKDYSQIDKLSKKYKIDEISASNYVYTEFPFKNKFSILLSIIKVYPELRKYVEQKGYKKNIPIMEIYDIPEKKIKYYIGVELEEDIYQRLISDK